MTKQELNEILQDALYLSEEEGNISLQNVMTFEDAGLLTNDTGIVIQVSGKKFNITIQEVAK